MGLFSFFSRKSFDPKLLSHLEKRDIGEEEFKNFLSGLGLKDPFGYANSHEGLNDLLSVGGTKEEYLSFFQERFNLLEKYSPGRSKKALSYKFNILNPLISIKNLDDACRFFRSVGVDDPFEYIDTYGYSIFYRGGKIDKVIEKYEYIKNQPYLQGKLKNILEFTLLSTVDVSIKTIENELEIYHECDMIDTFLSEINRFDIIQKGKEKLKVFEELGFTKEQRNKYLKKNFISVMNYKTTPELLRDILSQSK